MSIEAIRMLTENQFIICPKELVGTYVFQLGDISKDVTVKIYRNNNNKYIFEQSHFIKTPVQCDAYITSIPVGDDFEMALSRCISGFTSYYSEAINAGHTPSEDWLQVNEYFK